jgi:nucleoid DNA-binding protein
MPEINKLKSKKSWNKTDLTVLLANQADIPKVRAAHYINILTNTISEALENGKKVTISDFGTFQVSERRSFNGRNPKTGAPLIVPVRRIPVFRAGKLLKTSLNIPQIKECILISPKKICVRFSKLMDNSHVNLTAKSSYRVMINGKSIGALASVNIHEEEEESRPNQNEVLRTVDGVRSVILTSKKSLMVGNELMVEVLKPLLDVDGNVTE